MSTFEQIELEWEDCFATGISDIDQLHQILFGCYDDLVQSVKLGLSCRIVATACNNIYVALQHSFAIEEVDMEGENYIYVGEHAEKHAEILKRASEILNCDCRDESVVYKAHALISQWVNQHLLVEDSRFASYRASSYRASIVGANPIRTPAESMTLTETIHAIGMS